MFVLNRSFHRFIIGILVPIMALLRPEKGLDLQAALDRAASVLAARP